MIINMSEHKNKVTVPWQMRLCDGGSGGGGGGGRGCGRGGGMLPAPLHVHIGFSHFSFRRSVIKRHLLAPHLSHRENVCVRTTEGQEEKWPVGFER